MYSSLTLCVFCKQTCTTRVCEVNGRNRGHCSMSEQWEKSIIFQAWVNRRTTAMHFYYAQIIHLHKAAPNFGIPLLL